MKNYIISKRFVFDIEATGLLNQIINYKTLPYKLKVGHKMHCGVIKDIGTGEVWRYRPNQLQEFKEKLCEADEIIGHNIIGYDLPALLLFLGLTYKIDLEGKQDLLNGKPCKITDTLVWSRVLNPDRKGGHSLKAWGIHLGILKGTFGEDEGESVWTTFSEDMLDYNEQDVHVSEAVYKAVMEEAGDWPWEDAYNTEKITMHLVTLSEHVGFAYDKELADSNLKELNQWMKEITDRVEPLLPEKKLGKTGLKEFEPPAKQLKEDGSITSHMFRFIEKVGATYKKVEAKHLVEHNGNTLELPLKEPLGEDPLPKTQVKKDGSPSKAMEIYIATNEAKYKYTPPKYTMTYKGKEMVLPIPDEPIELYEPMRLANQKDMKEYLVAQGWNPSEWRENDLTIDSKKAKQTWTKFEESVRRYCLETKDSPFKIHRYKHLGVKSASEMYKKIMNRGLERPVKVLTAPKFTVGMNKDLCPDLERFGEKAGYVKDVVLWLTYRHRRNAIESQNGTGFNYHIREDGRIGTPANSCGAATSRFQHRIVCNLARVSSVYGEKMRRLFGVGNDCYQIGHDFASLEARVEGHFTLPYEGGEAYAESLLAEKPNDIHSLNARIMGVSRDEAKVLKYSTSYGAQPPKVASQMGWTLDKAKEVFDNFWEAAMPLKLLKEDQTELWKKTGKKFIIGIDKRKLWIRSEHSILNMLFQSTGVIAAKKANIFHNIEMEKKGILFNPFVDSSWKGKAAMMIHYHDEAQWCVHKDLVKVWKFKTEEEAKAFKLEGRVLSNVHKRGDDYEVCFSPSGELAVTTCQKASEYYKMNVSLGADYDVGKNWAECH